MQYTAKDFGLTFAPIPTEAEITARVAAYSARPAVQARWAEDARLSAAAERLLARAAA